MTATVYILECADGSFYVGSARGSGLENRLAQHEAGQGGAYTSRRLPVRLVYSEHFDRVMDAISAERQIKGWSRAKKKALIDGQFELLKLLSKRRGGRGIE